MQNIYITSIYRAICRRCTDKCVKFSLNLNAFAILRYLIGSDFVFENLYFDSHSRGAISLRHHRGNNLTLIVDVTISDTTISLLLFLSPIARGPRLSIESVLFLFLPSLAFHRLFFSFVFVRRGGNWREPRRSTRREPLWRTVNPFRLFLSRPQAEKSGKRGEGGVGWKKNQFSSDSFIGTDSCRRADCSGKGKKWNWHGSYTANDERNFSKVHPRSYFSIEKKNEGRSRISRESMGIN